MVLTLKEHLDTLESRNHINKRAAIAVLTAASESAGFEDGIDVERLETLQVSVMVDVMAIAHQEYPEFYAIYSRKESAETEEIKERVRNTAYILADGILDDKYFPKKAKESWVHLITTYLDTYHQVLTGNKRRNSLSVLDQTE